MLLAGAKKIKQGFEDTECWQGNRAKQMLFLPPAPERIRISGGRGVFTKLEYLILNHRFRFKRPRRRQSRKAKSCFFCPPHPNGFGFPAGAAFSTTQPQERGSRQGAHDQHGAGPPALGRKGFPAYWQTAPAR
jgi:hypothetical protein